MRTCPHCGQANEPDADFCARCTRYLGFGTTAAPGAQAGAPPGVAGPPPTQPTQPGFAAPPARARSRGARHAGLQPSAYSQAPPPRPVPVEEREPVRPGELACSVCGTGNDPSLTFCRRCGTELRERRRTAATVLGGTGGRSHRREIIASLIGACVVAGAALAIVLTARGDRPASPSAAAPTTTAAPVATSGPTAATAISVPSTATTATPAGPAAGTCPDGAAATRGASASFAVSSPPPPGGETILLLRIAIGDRNAAVSICRAGDRYSYFSRDVADPGWGTYAGATRGAGPTFEAWYPGSEGGPATFVVSPAGITADGTSLGAATVVCGDPGSLDPAWASVLTAQGAATRCTASLVPPWTPPG